MFLKCATMPCMSECRLCPVNCGADRENGRGACGAGKELLLVKYGLHPYEEPCISYKNGSGTVFFGGCALRCAFCQNYELSRAQTGEAVSAARLAQVFSELEERGAENINLVTAAHFVPQLLEAFRLYRPKVPVVYNTHAYETLAALRALDPYIDVWLPDLKFYAPKIAARYTGRADYFAVASRAVAFMAARTPDVRDGKMFAGCIVRHLILPLCTDDSLHIIDWFAQLRPPATFSLMAQYTPCGEADKYPELRRRITPREYKKVRTFLENSGIPHAYVQELAAADERFIPDFTKGKSALF